MAYQFAQGLLAIAIVLASGAPALAANPLHNPNNPLDVDDNGSVRPSDFLLIANRIQTQPSASLDGISTSGTNYYWDTSDDNRVTPRDALLVANHLMVAPEPSTLATAGVALLALAGYCWRRRRKRG
jgi:MYXO-CTERM domain-containing protein